MGQGLRRRRRSGADRFRRQIIGRCRRLLLPGSVGRLCQSRWRHRSSRAACRVAARPSAVFRPAVETIDSEGRSHRFGNMTLSRLPMLQVASHLLPWPQDRSPRSMRRQALEVTVQAAFGPLRIVNTHLEYYSAAQREAQIVRLLDLQQEASTYRQAADARRALWKADDRGVQPAVRRLQFRCLRPAACDAACLITAGTELSRRVDDLPPGPAAPADLRPS